MSAHPNPRAWVYSTTANYHLCSSRELFTTYDPIEALPLQSHFGPVNLDAKGIGSVELEIQKSNGTRAVLKLTDVLYVPEATVNLVSTSGLAKDGGVRFEFHTGKALGADGSEFAWFPHDSLWCLKLADGDDRLYPSSVRDEDKGALALSARVQSQPVKKPKMSKYQFIKQGWGSRPNFQYSYGLKSMRP